MAVVIGGVAVDTLADNTREALVSLDSNSIISSDRDNAIFPNLVAAQFKKDTLATSYPNMVQVENDISY